MIFSLKKILKNFKMFVSPKFLNVEIFISQSEKYTSIDIIVSDNR